VKGGTPWSAAVCAAAASVLSLGLPNAAQSQERSPLILEPTSDWVLDYADERCSLNRTYGESPEALFLRIDSFGSVIGYRFQIAGPTVPPARVPTSEMTIRFTPDAEDRKTQSLHGKVGELPAVSFSASFATYEDSEAYTRMSRAQQMAYSAQPKQPEPEFEAKVTTVIMGLSNGRAVQLSLGNMARPLAAMRDCVGDLHSSWGLDPAEHQGLTRLAIPKLSTVRRVQRNYPSNMLWSGTNAYVPVRVMVDATGEATACVVQIEEIGEAFKEAVCRGLARGYEPALDREGMPVASVYSTSVFYLVN
jgi:hypothetical protein